MKLIHSFVVLNVVALGAADGWAQIGYSRYGWKERNQAAAFGPRCLPELQERPQRRAGDLGTRNPSTGALHGPIIVTGPGPGPTFGPPVRGWRYKATGITDYIPSINFYAYNTLSYGVNVGTGDVFDDPATGDYEEILTGAGPGAIFGPHVRSWTWHWTGAGGRSR
ncbi:MAG: hypothetical protein U0166_08725 [Acidobacteriota bacterium]